MHRICYMSRAIREIRLSDVEDIVSVSARLNDEADITGYLLCDGVGFMQAIEGPKAAIFKTFERICADDRHYGIVEFDNRATLDRQFGSWAMRYQSMGQSNSDDFVRDVITSLRDVQDTQLVAHFVGFAALMRRQLSPGYRRTALPGYMSA